VNPSAAHTTWWSQPAAVAESARPPAELVRLAGRLATAAALYGAAFGWWRGGWQVVWSAAKLPALLLVVTATCALANYMLAAVLGMRLGFRQSLHAMVHAFAVAALVLAALAPVFIFLAVALPGPESPDATRTYALLLAAHTAAVALAGVIGNLNLWRSLLTLARGRHDLAARVLAGWLTLCGLVGSEWSWVLSPFLTHPERPLVFLNPNAFRMNMYEYLWTVTRPPQQEAAP
jgi:hypothetical protein